MRKAHLYLLMLIATVGFVPNAEAKIREKSWEFGALIGNVDGDRGAGIGNGAAFDIRIGYNFTPKFTSELSLSTENADQTNQPSDGMLAFLAAGDTPFHICPSVVSASAPPCLVDVFTGIKGEKNKSDHFRRAIFSVTGNLLTDRDIRTVPYITAGLGFIQETRDGFDFTAGLVESVDDDMDPNTARKNVPITQKSKVLEAFDSSAILTIGVGARTFLSDNWGVRYEIRYSHHDSFDAVQDEYVVCVGATWVVGGKN